MDRCTLPAFVAAFTPSGTFFERLGSSGPAVVFIHGLGCDLTMWSGLNRLSTHRLILTYDLAGHGRTRIETPSSFDGYVEQLAELLMENHVSSCALVGFSLGAVIGASMAAARPERVSGLVLSNVPFRRTKAELERARARIKQIEVEGIRKAAPSLVHRWLPGDFLRDREELEQRLVDMLCRNRKDDFLKAYALALAGDSVLEEVTEGVRCPSVVLGGTEDSSVREGCLDLLSAKLRSHSVTVKGAGHMLPMQFSVRFIGEVERFLDESASQSH